MRVSKILRITFLFVQEEKSVKAFKIILSIVGILCVLFVLQLYIHSLEPHPFVWEEEELHDLVTALGATDFSISEDNIVTFSIHEGNALFDSAQGQIRLFPGALMDEAIAIPDGQDTVEPVLFRNENGLFQGTFSDGEQQLFRTQEQSRTFAIQQALRQIVLQCGEWGDARWGICHDRCRVYACVWHHVYDQFCARRNFYVWGVWSVFCIFYPECFGHTPNPLDSGLWSRPSSLQWLCQPVLG